MKPQTIILYGCTGSGKGTQAALLAEYFVKRDPERRLLQIQTGEGFRNLAKGDSYTSRRVREMLDSGSLMPPFLPISLWGPTFIENLTGEEHLIIDGFPRPTSEAPVFHSAMEFYERHRPLIFVLNVTAEVVMERLMKKRKRDDDKEEEIHARLAWYQEHVVPTIEFFREHPFYAVYDLNGAAPVEEVQDAIIARIEENAV